MKTSSGAQQGRSPWACNNEGCFSSGKWSFSNPRDSSRAAGRCGEGPRDGHRDHTGNEHLCWVASSPGLLEEGIGEVAAGCKTLLCLSSWFLASVPSTYVQLHAMTRSQAITLMIICCTPRRHGLYFLSDVMGFKLFAYYSCWLASQWSMLGYPLE